LMRSLRFISTAPFRPKYSPNSDSMQARSGVLAKPRMNAADELKRGPPVCRRLIRSPVRFVDALGHANFDGLGRVIRVGQSVQEVDIGIGPARAVIGPGGIVVRVDDLAMSRSNGCQKKDGYGRRPPALFLEYVVPLLFQVKCVPAPISKEPTPTRKQAFVGDCSVAVSVTSLYQVLLEC
jgi:hypothetical protein